MKKAMILPFLGLMLLTACQAQSQIDSSRSSSSKSVATYFEVRSNPIKITTDDQYKVTLDATDTWEFSVQEGQEACFEIRQASFNRYLWSCSNNGC